VVNQTSEMTQRPQKQACAIAVVLTVLLALAAALVASTIAIFRAGALRHAIHLACIARRTARAAYAAVITRGGRC
jgi:CDP-diacylglycerol pyrophosphatase